MGTILNSRIGHYFGRLGILLLVVALTMGTTGCPEVDDTGEPTKIGNWNDLNAIRNNLTGSYILVDNLDSNSDGWNELVNPQKTDGRGWEPIGNSTNPFKGTFDGNGYEIKDLFINRNEEDQVGLFGYTPKANLKDITVLGANVTGRENVGIVVGENEGNVENCSSSGSVTGTDSTGGLAGYNGGYGTVSSSVRDCESTATVCGGKRRTGGLVGHNAPGGYIDSVVFGGNVTGMYQVGGLVGLNNREVKNSEVSETVTVTGVDTVGGWVGYNTPWPLAVVDNCHFYGEEVEGGPYVGCSVLLGEGSAVTALSLDSYEIGWYISGGVGVNNGTVKDCTSEGIVYGGNYVGGVVAANNGTVENCSSDSNVYGEYYVGGVVAANNGTMENCSSGGSVTGKDYVGGLVGYNAKKGTVSNSNSVADVKGTGIYVGKLVGWNEGIVSGSRVRSTYKLICDVPAVIVAGEETTIPVTLKTDQLGELGYDGVQLHLKVYPRAGDVTIKFDSWSFTNELYSQEYDLPADYNQTIYPTVYCIEPGEYTFTFSLIEALYGPVINDMTESITVSVVEARRLSQRASLPPQRTA